MKKNSLILTISLVLIAFLSLSMVSAEAIADDDSVDNDILQTEDTPALTAKEVTVNTTDTNDQIQEKINSLSDGDTLNFEKGEYKNVSLYVNKSITINGNGATLYGYDKLSNETINHIIQDKTVDGGYAITNLATLYILKTDGLVLKDINIVAGANSGTSMGKDSRYSNCVIYNYYSTNTTIRNTTIDGCSWGIWLQNCADTVVEYNRVMNQGITGIFSFQSPRSIIRFNNVTNAKNHGIDVRHQVGPNATVTNNIVIGSKEGIYLLHSKGHNVTNNTIRECSLSSITCCGASDINIENNKLLKSRIGILLGGGAPAGGVYTGYNNINIGENEWTFDKLPMPPSFEFYVAEAKGDYASISSMMGTYTDSEISDVTYVEYKGIETPKEIVIDYDTILKPTGNLFEVPENANSTQIQTIINSMNNGDTLFFAKNAVYENISIYIVNKTIKIIGNNATLKGLNEVNTDAINASGIADSYNAKSYSSILYCVNNTGIVISNLNMIGNYPNYSNPNGKEYQTACIFAESSKNITITGCNVDGASWGIFVGFQKNGCPNSIITNNKVSNQYTTGIICFGSQNSVIINNTVTNAKNHGIDVRFKAGGQNVIVFNNTVSGAKEGIYLLHSFGHKVYENTILNSKISSITCYGAYNLEIFNNTLSGSRIAILLGGNYHENVTIGPNAFTPDKLPFPPTFEFYVVQGEYRYQSSTGVIGTYSDSKAVNLTAKDVTVGYKKGTFEITLKDAKGNPIANKTGSITINGVETPIKTNNQGIASIDLALTAGTYTASVHTASDYYNKAGNAEATITVTDDRTATAITAPAKSVYVQAIAKGISYQVTLKDAKGTLLVGKDIVVDFNGQKLNAKTNDKGIATVTLKYAKAGSPKATVSFAGDNTYKPIKATATVKVTKEATKITAKKKTFKAKSKTKKYTVTLKSKSGKKLSSVKVTLKVKGKKYTATVKKGKATFNLKKLTKKGKHTATITFAGSKYFDKSNAKIKITIK